MCIRDSFHRIAIAFSKAVVDHGCNLAYGLRHGLSGRPAEILHRLDHTQMCIRDSTYTGQTVPGRSNVRWTRSAEAAVRTRMTDMLHRSRSRPFPAHWHNSVRSQATPSSEPDPYISPLLQAQASHILSLIHISRGHRHDSSQLFDCRKNFLNICMRSRNYVSSYKLSKSSCCF